MRCLEVYKSGNALIEDDDKNTFCIDPTGAVIWGACPYTKDEVLSCVKKYLSEKIDSLYQSYEETVDIAEVWSSDLVRSLSGIGVDADTFLHVTGHEFSRSTRVVKGLLEHRLIGGETVVLTEFRFGDRLYYIGWSSYGAAYWWRLHGTR